MRLDGDAWADYWTAFRREAFRIELLPQYLVPQEAEAFAAFKDGRPMEPVGPGWHRTIQAAADRGAVMRRVHVITLPLSDYLRFEFSRYYVLNCAAGEDIRILDLSMAGDLDLPPVDYWLFDEREVVEMRYEPDGVQIGRELLEDADVDSYLRWRDTAWQAAIPFGQFWDARS